MNRRMFFKSAGSAAVVTGIARGAQISPTEPIATKENHLLEFVVNDQSIFIETSILRLDIEKGELTRLENKKTGESYLTEKGPAGALYLLYEKDELVSVNEEKFGTITTKQLADDRAQVIFHNWDGDGVVMISVDHESGDILIEPSAYSSRPGVR
ncbi:MAG: hypothetical protein EHM72_10675, partial [Calditrichaeota bacterium]